MENKDWLNDYEMLKQVNPFNPFLVPDGYFDDLGSRIVLRIKLDEIKANGSAGGFTVPDGYFDNLTSKIESRISVEQIAGSETSGFIVPDGYFDELTSNIKSRVALEETVDRHEMGFNVPDGYFDELTSNIQSRIAIEEVVNADEIGFTTPEGYFDTLGGQINARILIEEAGGKQGEFAVPDGYFAALEKDILNKTVKADVSRRRHGVVRRLFASTAFKYATAACVALAIGGGIVVRELSDNAANAHRNSFLHKELSTVPISEIKSYLQLNLDAGDTQQTISNDGSVVDDSDLRQALQSYADSVQ